MAAYRSLSRAVSRSAKPRELTNTSVVWWLRISLRMLRSTAGHTDPARSSADEGFPGAVSSAPAPPWVRGPRDGIDGTVTVPCRLASLIMAGVTPLMDGSSDDFTPPTADWA